MKPRTPILWGALFCACGVAAGAVGAHLLEKRFADAPRLSGQFDTAVRYQIIQGLGLILVGLLAKEQSKRCLTAAAVTMVLGTLLFSGGLYLHIAAVLTPLPLYWAVHLVPFGGALMIASWIVLAVYAALSKT